MADCLISITAKSITGAALANATVTFTRLPGDALTAQDGATIWPASVQVVCDAGGLGSVTLKTGDYSYQVSTATGAVRGRITVPDVVATTLELLLGAAQPPYVTITWAEYQALVSATAMPAASVAAGLAAVADGVTFLAVSDDGVAIIRRVAGAAVPAFVEL